MGYRFLREGPKQRTGTCFQGRSGARKRKGCQPEAGDGHKAIDRSVSFAEARVDQKSEESETSRDALGREKGIGDRIAGVEFIRMRREGHQLDNVTKKTGFKGARQSY